MRICLVTGEYPPMVGGVSDYTSGLAAHLREAGHAVAIVSSVDAEGEGVHTLTSWSVPALPRLRARIRSLKPDVVHIQYQTAAFGLGGGICLLPLVVGLKTVVTFHDTREPYLFPKAGKLRRGANAVLARSAANVVVTNVEDLRSVKRLGARHAEVVPLGNNVEPRLPPSYDRDAARRAVGAGPGDFLVGHFGLLAATKGVGILIEAIAAVPSAKLVFIGSATGDADPTNAEERRKARAALRQYGIESRTRWTGHLQAGQLSEYLVACDALALPYLDGASFRRTTLIAALAHGVPVVTTEAEVGSLALSSDSAAGLPEIRHGRECWLVARSDSAALARALGDLDADLGLRRSLGAGGAVAAASFSWQNVTERLVSVYREVVGG